MTTTEHRPEPPILPEWARDRDALTSSSRILIRRATDRTARALVQAPAVLFWLLVVYPWRGLARLVARLSRYLYDYDSAVVRHEHAGRMETAEYVKAQNARKANLKARWMVAATVALVTVGPVLAWTFPRILSGLVGALFAVWLVKVIPGRNAWEVPCALAAGVAIWWFGPYALAAIPRPATWAVVAALLAAWTGLGWVGRPANKPLVKDGNHAPAVLPKPTADLVISAIIASVPGITEKQREDFRVHTPGVARARHGYHVSMELPPGSTVSDVAENREAFAAACRRPLGTIWPSAGHMHPGHMKLYIGDEPMATAPQTRWPLADGKPVDIFDRLPLFTDQEGRWFEQRLAYNAIVIGGAPGYGKSYALRELGVAVAFDPRVRIVCLDGKGNGDLRPLRLVAHGFHEGDEPEDIAEQLAAVQAIREEMRRRARFLRDLPKEENPEDKVTSELVDRYPNLAPIVLLIDECQVYTEHEDKTIREAFESTLADLVRRGRSAGIIPVFCTQKPDAKVIPTSITDNCSVRICFRVNGQRANDAVLGTEMHSRGIKATKFGADDKGLAWLKGDGADPLVVRSVHGLDKVVSEELMVKARAVRSARGLLTGYAAGEEAEAEADQVDLLADCRSVMDHPVRSTVHLAGLLDRLAEMRPALYGPMDVAGLGSALRGAGVRTGTVWVPGDGDGKGVKREWLDVTATEDADPDAA